MMLSSSLKRCMVLHICQTHVVRCAMDVGLPRYRGQVVAAPHRCGCNCGHVVWATVMPSATHQSWAWSSVWCPSKTMNELQNCRVVQQNIDMHPAPDMVCANQAPATRWQAMAQLDTNRHWLHAKSMAGALKSGWCLPCLLALGV